MNILLTTVSLHPERGGGTAERTKHLALNLKAVGNQCAVVTIEGGRLADELIAAGISVYVTGSSRIRFALPHLNLARLAQLIKAADVVHVLGYWNMLSVAISALAARYGKPYALSAAGEFVGVFQPSTRTMLFHAIFGQRMIQGAGSLLAITELEREQILERFGMSADRVIVVPNGVGEPAMDSHILLPPLPSAPFILFLGRLAPVKGPDLLLEAFGKVANIHPDVSLVLAGPDFGLDAELRRSCTALNLEHRVSFTGFMDEGQRTLLYRSALFLTVPSRSEAMSLVALEAGMTGLPVLLTDQCGFDAVAALPGGIVVPATAEGLQRGLEQMLGHRVDLPRWGENLRLFVVDNYSWPTIVDRLQRHFAKLIDSQR